MKLLQIILQILFESLVTTICPKKRALKHTRNGNFITDNNVTTICPKKRALKHYPGLRLPTELG